jgi:acyl-CoA reductase-like NAD-dependent aldehyde dehydrogenase
VNAAQKLSGDADFSIPQRTVAFAAKIESLVKNATDNGATFLYGDGSRDNSRVSPMLLENVDKNMDIADMESFGPVCYISEVESAEAAVQLINSGKYGLSTSIWSQNTLRAISLARAVESGAVHINGITVHDAPDVPHGGVKESGYGRFNSRWGLAEFRYVKTITLA